MNYQRGLGNCTLSPSTPFTASSSWSSTLQLKKLFVSLLVWVIDKLTEVLFEKAKLGNLKRRNNENIIHTISNNKLVKTSKHKTFNTRLTFETNIVFSDYLKQTNATLFNWIFILFWIDLMMVKSWYFKLKLSEDSY